LRIVRARAFVALASARLSALDLSGCPAVFPRDDVAAARLVAALPRPGEESSTVRQYDTRLWSGAGVNAPGDLGGERVRALGRQQPLRPAALTGTDQLVDAVHGGGDVGQADDPVLDVLADQAAALPCTAGSGAVRTAFDSAAVTSRFPAAAAGRPPEAGVRRA
jgi:hypothetical protein